MEKIGCWERKSLMSEPSEGIELTNELKKLLQKEEDSSNEALKGFLVDKIVSCYDNALSLLNCMDTPTTHVSNLLDFKDQVVHNKRKRWSEEVGDDGFNWRKYGQKDIMGATHPRSYYRYTRGCLATKQVQRGEPPVACRGKHTCVANTNDGDDSSKQEDMRMIKIESNVVEGTQLLSEETTETELYYFLR